MKFDSTDLLICVAFPSVALMSHSISRPVSKLVERLVIPWRERYKEDGTRIDSDRVLEIKIGPVSIVDRPVREANNVS